MCYYGLLTYMQEDMLMWLCDGSYGFLLLKGVEKSDGFLPLNSEGVEKSRKCWWSTLEETAAACTSSSAARPGSVATRLSAWQRFPWRRRLCIKALPTIFILGEFMRSYKVIPYTEDGMALAQRLRAVAHELERVTFKMLSTLEPILHLSQYFGLKSFGSPPG